MPEETRSVSAARYSCQECARTDLSLTANGRIRSHTANGKRKSDDNPHCPGGSDYPKHDHDYIAEAPSSDVPVCVVCGKPDPRPTAEEVRDAECVINHPGAPDDAYAQAEAVLETAEEEGIRLLTAPAGHPEAPSDDAPPPRGGPNPHRSPLPGGVHDNASPKTRTPDPHAHEAAAAIAAAEADQRAWDTEYAQSLRDAAPKSDADAMLDDDVPEQDTDTPPYFGARYDGSCDTCGADFAEGDTIRRSSTGGWEAEQCCGDEIDEEASQRPRATAPQLPVRNGRYVGPDPDTGKQTSWMRSTRFASTVANTFALTLWELRMAGMGLVKRPDLLEKVRNTLQANGGVPYEVAKSQREFLNTVMEDAKLAAGSKDRARKGTILHKHTQEIDMGRKSLGDVPEEFRASAGAYLLAMADLGFECIPDLIERSTLWNEIKVAGTFDRVLHVTRDHEEVTLDNGRRVQLHAGDYVIGDVKSGQDLKYAWLEIMIQLAIYANGVAETGVAVPDDHDGGRVYWRWADLAEFGIDKIRTDVGIVMHAPYGEARCGLYYADLITGARGVKVSQTAAAWLKQDSPMTPVATYTVKSPKTFTPAGGQAVSVAQTVTGDGEVISEREMIATRPRRTWEDVARAVSTKEEANKVWAEMSKRKAQIGMTRINAVVEIMRETLREKGAV